MLAKTESMAIVGTAARLVDVEVHVGTGVPRFSIVGLPAKSVREAEQRTRSALESVGESWPSSRIVANLAPGALRKDGTHFDLPIALGVLAARERIEAERLEGWVVIGELALDGSLRAVRGALAAAMATRQTGKKGLICPELNAGEATLVSGIEVVPVASLAQCVGFLRGEADPSPVEVATRRAPEPAEDMSEVCGHEGAKRALETAAGGGHNLLLVGPPGSGKTMLAHRLPGILPEMTSEESLDVTLVYSVAGLIPERAGLVERRPFRVPHHHVSVAGLIGGGSGLARPGEASLAHHGVLFLDELALYRRDVLDSLRAPVEEGVVRIARSGGSISYPCRFCLIAAMNPCLCGYLGDSRRACRCSERDLQLYNARLSGPLLDRFDMQVAMPRLDNRDLLSGPRGESSGQVRARVERAREIQAARYSSPLVTNASAPKARLEPALALTGTARATVQVAADALALSGRAVDRVLRVARTLADLEGRSEVDDEHVGEALSYRAPDRHSRAA